MNKKQDLISKLRNVSLKDLKMRFNFRAFVISTGSNWIKRRENTKNGLSFLSR